MNATASSFLGWLLRSSWQAAVLTLLVLIAQFCLRKRLDGRWRHLLWLLVLARLALPFSPPSPASLFNYLRFEPGPMQPQTVSSVGFAAMPAEPPVQIQPSVSLRAVHVATAPMDRLVSAPVLPVPAKRRWTMPKWPDVLALLWAVGVAALAVRVVVQNLLFRRRLRDGTNVDESRMLGLFADCKASMRVGTPVSLIETGLVDSPALYGLFRPRLLLPPKLAERFSESELRHIFLHEMAHVRRRDMAAQWIVTCFQIAHWFNPILWFGFRRMAADRELACDELALSVVGESEGPSYGQTIVKLLEACSEMPALPGLVGILEDKSQIFQRVSMIAGFKRHPRWSLAGTIAGVALGLATLTGAQTKKPLESSRPDLTGTVRMSDGQPAKATVFIFTAGPRVGTSPFCPSCYPDCTKSAKTDRQGRFKIESLDPQLIFRVLVIGKGCAPSSITHVDPAVKPIDVTLQPVRQGIGPDRQIRGRVADARGKPVADAVVNIRGVTRASGTQFGGNKDVDQLAVTDDDGKFVINAEDKFDAIGVDVEAHGFAKGVFQSLATGGEIHELKLTEGATVKGRLVKEGQPLAGVDICISDDDRRAEAYAGNFSVGTDKDGRFAFINVPPDRDYVVTATMDSLGPRGFTPGAQVRTGGDGSIADAGDVKVFRGFTVAGKIRLTDGQPIPLKTEVMLSRPEAWDASHCVADGQGNFRFVGVPRGTITLSARIKGYRLSDRNKSLDFTRFRLMGVIVGDKTDLIVEFEPGERHSSEGGTHADLRGFPLAGVEAEKPADGDFHVTGAVIDAGTRKPLDGFAITKGYDDPAPLGPTQWITTIQGTNGRFDILLSTNPFNRANVVTIQADGYMPQCSWIITAETNVTLELTRGVGRTGVVLKPDGHPAAGVRVYLTDEQSAVYVADPEMKVNEDQFGTQRTQITNTDSSGRFTFKPGLDDKAIVVLADAGFAQVGVQELSGHPEVKLRPWSKVEGQLLIGSRPGANETIRLEPAFNRLDGYHVHDSPSLTLCLEAHTDNEGRFSFDRVPPIDVEVYHDPWAGDVKPDGKPHLGSRSQTVSFSLKPGEIKTVTLGGKGRPVIGQLVLNAYEGKINWRNAPQHFNLILAPTADFDDHQALLDELNEKIEAATSEAQKNALWHERAMLEYETARKRHAFVKTEKGKEYYFQNKTYDLDIAPDGSFRIEDVPGGKYSMHIVLHQEDWLRQRPKPPIANFTKDFDIPDSPGGQSDEAFDLGRIEIQATKDWSISKAASNSEVKH
jgi:beta-lactamase regulating signal transducer with metallopeptidase domain/uncharacterized GH25 family protein